MITTILEKAAEKITEKKYFEIDLIAIVAVADIVMFLGYKFSTVQTQKLFNFDDVSNYINFFVWCSYLIFLISSIGFILFNVLQFTVGNIGEYNEKRYTWFWRAKLGNKILCTRMFHYIILGNQVLYLLDTTLLDSNTSRIMNQNLILNIYLTIWTLYLGIDLMKAVYFRHFHYTEIVEGLD